MKKILFVSLLLLASCQKEAKNENPKLSELLCIYVEYNPKHIPIAHATTSCNKIKYGIYKVFYASEAFKKEDMGFACCSYCITEDAIDHYKHDHDTFILNIAKNGISEKNKKAEQKP